LFSLLTKLRRAARFVRRAAQVQLYYTVCTAACQTSTRRKQPKYAFCGQKDLDIFPVLPPFVPAFIFPAVPRFTHTSA